MSDALYTVSSISTCFGDLEDIDMEEFDKSDKVEAAEVEATEADIEFETFILGKKKGDNNLLVCSLAVTNLIWIVPLAWLLIADSQPAIVLNSLLHKLHLPLNFNF